MQGDGTSNKHVSEKIFSMQRKNNYKTVIRQVVLLLIHIFSTFLWPKCT